MPGQGSFDLLVYKILIDFERCQPKPALNALYRLLVLWMHHLGTAFKSILGAKSVVEALLVKATLESTHHQVRVEASIAVPDSFPPIAVQDFSESCPDRTQFDFGEVQSLGQCNS